LLPDKLSNYNQAVLDFFFTVVEGADIKIDADEYLILTAPLLLY